MREKPGLARTIGAVLLILVFIVLFFNVTRPLAKQGVAVARSDHDRHKAGDSTRDLARDKKRDIERDKERDAKRDKIRDFKRDMARDKERDWEWAEEVNVILNVNKENNDEEGVIHPEEGDENKKIASSTSGSFRFNWTAFEHLVSYKPMHKELVKKRPPKSYFMVIMVMCHLTSRGMRDSQRATWMQYPIMYHHKLRPNAPIRAYFVVGREGREDFEELEQEQEAYGDVVLLDSDDGPHDQKFIAFVHYLEKEGIHYDFFSKVDTDTFLRPLLLANDILALPKSLRQRMYLGSGWEDKFVLCDKMEDHLVFFHTGSTIVLSRDILEWVSRSSPREIEYCNFTEDVRTGYWVQEFALRTNQTVNILQSGSYCQPPINIWNPNNEHERCVSFHLGLAKDYHRELFQFMYDNWPIDGREPVPDFFPWAEFEKLLILYRNEYWKAQNLSNTADIWNPSPPRNARPNIYEHRP